LGTQPQDSTCDSKPGASSLGEIASKKPGASDTKIRVDDDSLDSVISKVKESIPDISFDGLENANEIVTATSDEKAHHSPNRLKQS
jgi:hypothetical protein